MDAAQLAAKAFAAVEEVTDGATGDAVGVRGGVGVELANVFFILLTLEV